MEERNVTVTLNKAKEWFNSGNATLKEIALQAFDKDELTYNFKNITTFKRACEALGLNYDDMFYITKNIATISKASAAMFKLNIIRKALNLGQDLHLTKDLKDSYIYYPYNPFVTKSSTYYKSEINSGKMEVIGKIKSEGEEYNVLGGIANDGRYAGLGSFGSYFGVGYADAALGFLGCANKEIAQHLGKYFGMLIIEAKYGDLEDFKITIGGSTIYKVYPIIAKRIVFTTNDIVEECKLHINSVNKVLNKLVEQGYLIKEKKKGTTRVTFTYKNMYDILVNTSN